MVRTNVGVDKASRRFIDIIGGADHQATGADTWEDWDISALVPAGTIAAQISVRNASGTARVVGMRKNGSALTRSINLYNTGDRTWTTEVDANRVLEIYVATAVAGFYFNALGYWI